MGIYNEKTDFDTDLCSVCPRKCGVDRRDSFGFCKVGNKIVLSRSALHMWEEPCLSYGKGSGTLFFAGCNLRCVFCQNSEISKELKGKKIDIDTLSYEMLKLQDMGAVNINLVTPTHFSMQILKALEKVKHKLNIPVVYNCSGYESVETLRLFEDYIDIYLPDIKYYSHVYSEKYSSCPDYFDTAKNVIVEMHRQVGYATFDKNGHMTRGLLVRHLVLPSLYKDSMKIFDEIARIFDVNKMAISIMSQYFPTENVKEYPEINRRVTSLEYNRVVEHVKGLGFKIGFIQDKTSARECYVPKFDYSEKETLQDK